MLRSVHAGIGEINRRHRRPRMQVAPDGSQSCSRNRTSEAGPGYAAMRHCDFGWTAHDSRSPADQTGRVGVRR